MDERPTKYPPPDPAALKRRRVFLVLTEREVGEKGKGEICVLHITDGAAQALIQAGLVKPVEEKAVTAPQSKEADNG